jgi:putative flippase GtrA
VKKLDFLGKVSFEFTQVHIAIEITANISGVSNKSEKTVQFISWNQSSLSKKIKILSRQLILFFLASGLAVLVDIAIYAFLVNMYFYPGICNLISSSTAVTLTYFLVTKKAFATNVSWKSYFFFMVWYATSITCFSLLIQYLHSSIGVDELLAKFFTLPFSFAVNFTFSRILFSRKW